MSLEPDAPTEAPPALTGDQIVAARIWFDPHGNLTPAGDKVFTTLKADAHEHFRDACSAALAIATIALLGGAFLVHAAYQWSQRQDAHTQFWVGLVILGLPVLAYVIAVVAGLVHRGISRRDTYLARIEAFSTQMKKVALLDEDAYTALLSKTQRREATRRGARMALKGAVNGISALVGLPLSDITDLI